MRRGRERESERERERERAREREREREMRRRPPCLTGRHTPVTRNVNTPLPAHTRPSKATEGGFARDLMEHIGSNGASIKALLEQSFKTGGPPNPPQEEDDEEEEGKEEEGKERTATASTTT